MTEQELLEEYSEELCQMFTPVYGIEDSEQLLNELVRKLKEIGVLND